MVETFEIIMFSYDVKGSFDTQNKNDDDDADDVMMLSTRIQLTLRNVERWAGRMASPCSQNFVSRCLIG